MSSPQDVPYTRTHGLHRPPLSIATEKLGMSPPLSSLSPTPTPLATSPLSWGQRRASLSLLAGACAVGAALDLKASEFDARSSLSGSSPSISALSVPFGALQGDTPSPLLQRPFGPGTLQRYHQPFKRRFSAPWFAGQGADPSAQLPPQSQPHFTPLPTQKEENLLLPQHTSPSQNTSRPQREERGRGRARTTGARFTRPSPRGERFLMGQMDML